MILENLIKITECTCFIMISVFLMNLEIGHWIAVSLPIWETILEVHKIQFIYLIKPGINRISAWIYCVNWIFSLKLLSQDICHSLWKCCHLKVKNCCNVLQWALKSIARTGTADYFYTVLFIYPHQHIDCSSVVQALWYLSWEKKMNNEIEAWQGYLTEWLYLQVVINLLDLMVLMVKQVFSQFKGI